MTKLLDELFRADDSKAFIPLMKKFQEDCGTPSKALLEVTAYLPCRLYERYYGEGPPGSLFGLASALQIEPLLPETLGWLPYVQQLFLAARERKRMPWEFPEAGKSDRQSPAQEWSQWEEAAWQSDLDSILRLSGNFLGPEDRDLFRLKSLHFAAADLFLGGHKLLYLQQLWKLVDHIPEADPLPLLFPALHFLLLAPVDRRAWQEADAAAVPSPAATPSAPPEELARRFESLHESLLFAESLQSPSSLLFEVLERGAPVSEVLNVLGTAAAQAICNSQAGKVAAPLRAYQWIAFLGEWIERLDFQSAFRCLIQAASLLHQASRLSREQARNRPLEELAGCLCPVDPVETLKSAVSHSDPYAAADAALGAAQLDEVRLNSFFEALVSLACRNDAARGKGHDILLVSQAISAFQACRSAARQKHLVAASFHLARVPKDYELCIQYGFK